MVELGQLEARHKDFDDRNAQIFAISLDDQETSQLTQRDDPHLVVISDTGRGLANAVEVIHPGSSPEGTDTTAPTTIIVDGAGQVRWVFRAERFLTRLTPNELLAAFDVAMPEHARQ